MAKGKKTGGRRSGIPNKATASIKAMLFELLHAERNSREWDQANASRSPLSLGTLHVESEQAVTLFLHN